MDIFVVYGMPGGGGSMGLADLDRPEYPLEGFAVDELAAALAAMVASPEVGQVRVLRVEARGNGLLLVQTGFQAGIRAGSGKYVLLRRTATGWAIAEVSRWKS